MLDVLDCDRDNNNVNKDDNGEDKDLAASVGAVIGAASAMRDGGWGLRAGRASATAGDCKDKNAFFRFR